MLHLLRNGPAYLWSSVLPVAAAIASSSDLHWQQSPTAPAAAPWWPQQQALASSAVLPEAAAADAADSRLLMGRGDPRTRKGKVFRGSYGKVRPKKKTDWKAWSEAQLNLPEQEIAIPYPPASKRTERVPPLMKKAELQDKPAELAESSNA